MTRTPPDFDWLCLADLLDHTGRPDAMRAALSLNLTNVCAALSSPAADDEARPSSALLPLTHGARGALDLSGIRVAYYSVEPAGAELRR